MKYTKKNIVTSGWVIWATIEGVTGFNLLAFPEMANDAMNSNILRYEKKVFVFPADIMQYWVQDEYERFYPEEIKDYMFSLMDAGNDVYDYINRREMINVEIFRKYLEISSPFVYQSNENNYGYYLLDCRTGLETAKYKISHEGEKFSLDISNETNLKYDKKDSLKVEVESTGEIFWLHVHDRLNLKIRNEKYDLPQPFVVRKYYKDEEKISIYKRSLEIIQVAQLHKKPLIFEVFQGW